MLTDAQKAFLVLLLGQFKLGCPHYDEEADDQKMMVDDIIKLLSPRAKTGACESDRDYERRVAAWLAGEDIRSKVDLREFKTADFHLSREPS